MALTGSSTSSTPNWKWKYHVFLSFRGDDTRKNFTDHLHAALHRARIVTFRDEEEIERGEIISEELNKAIEESLLAIVILSNNYASSSWCLNELQKIVESRNDSSSSLGHQTILPVFYDIDPSDVRYQKGSIGRAFEKHEQRYSLEKVQKWRQALTYVANLLGWDTRNKHEAGIIEDITASVWSKLRDKLRDEVPSNFDNFVGIETKANTLISMLNIRSVDKCFMGIWGMGGIGKTTLARVVFDAIKSKFQASCFLANIREESERNGLVYLQKELFLRMYPGSPKLINDSHEGVMALKMSSHDKRICIVLDDISHISQLENLAGNKEWFGDGSRIIVTTRDKHLLTSHGQFEKYEIEMLNKNESLELLCQKAFKKKCPEEGFVELSQKVVEYAGGLPLALQVLGSFLCKRSQSEWRDTLDKLKKILHRDIFKILRLSYDGLEDKELQKLFLDIACFFNWEEKGRVTEKLQNCGHHAIIGISVLIEKSLLSLKVGKDGVAFLYMHDLLQEMGKNIVLEDSPNDARRHSRLWSQWQVDQVLTREKGTEEIQGIGLELQQQFNANWHPHCFSNLPNLKLLYLRDVSLSNSLSSLPIALKVLIWKSYPLESLPQNLDQLYELVDLELRYSKITQLWSGKPILGNLKFINLSHSRFLIELPDLSGVSNLESLLLKYCTSLVGLHESVGKLKKLVKLSLRHCTNLETLPRKLEMDSLEELDLTRCIKLEMLPEFGENMNKLSIFDIRVCLSIREIPSSIIQLTNLKELSFRRCGGQGQESNSVAVGRLRFPDSLSGLSRLRKLDLSWCTLVDGSIPNDLSGLSSLVILDISGNNFVRLPIRCIYNLVNLEHLDMHGCSKLQSMPHLPPNLLTIDASGCPLMQRLKDVKVQHLFSKRRCIISDEVVILLISENAIPITWFKHGRYSVGPFGNSVCVRVDIPNIDEENEWLGTAVCLKVGCKRPDEVDVKYSFWWSFKDFENKSSSQENRKYYKRFVHPEPHLFVAFFPFQAQKIRV